MKSNFRVGVLPVRSFASLSLLICWFFRFACYLAPR